MQTYLPLANPPDDGRLIEYLQHSAESDRVALSRELHDELGGLLVSIIMDVAFAEQNMPLHDAVRQRLGRVRHSLAEAIDLKRKIIENLRPSMLDNFGLFEALKWELKQRCNQAHLLWSDSYPDVEPHFNEEALIALFRIGQELLNVASRQPSVTQIRLSVAVESDTLRMAISHDGEAHAILLQDDSLAICSVAHRAQAFGGELTLSDAARGAVYGAQLPLGRLLAEAAGPFGG